METNIHDRFDEMALHARTRAEEFISSRNIPEAAWWIGRAATLGSEGCRPIAEWIAWSTARMKELHAIR